VTTSQLILCLNSGSSSLKFALCQYDDAREFLFAKGAVERIGLSEGRVWLRSSDGSFLMDTPSHVADHQATVQSVFTALETIVVSAPERRWRIWALA
jgi:acetate kinase